MSGLTKEQIDRMVKDARFVGPEHPYAPALFDDLCCHIRALAERIEADDARIALALALTDTGSDEFKRAFPSRSLGAAMAPRESVPGWRVVEKIREALLYGRLIQ